MHALSRLQLHSFFIAVIGASLCPATGSLSAQEPLHQRIDEVFEETAIGPVAGLVDDLTFARRAYLDVIGRIPSAEETRAFLANDSADRRTQLVDQLLNSDDFPRHMATVFDVMLMERRGGKHVKTEDFRTWLQAGFAQDKPFNKLAAELIAADTSGANNTPAAFLLERDVEPNLVTREVGRMFFGMDLQCAQCHDHPNVADYKQEDYHGLFAFVSRSSMLQPDKKKPAVISESADGQSPFKSVFTERESFTAARAPGEAEIDEPVFAAGEEYKVRPAKTVAGVPKFSLRWQLAEIMERGENVYFRRNIANRLWAQVMGRGLVHPVDMHHSSNPPSNPRLMNLLADEFAAMGFKVKPFLRELLLTGVYQRSHRIEDSISVREDSLAAAIDQLEQQRAVSNEKSAAFDSEAQKALDQLDAAVTAAEPVRAAWAKARAAAAAAATKRDATAIVQQTKQTAFTSKQTLAANVTEAFKDANEAAALLADSKPLSGPLATLKSRSEKLTAEAAKLQKELEAAAKALATSDTVLANANSVEQSEREKLNPLKDKMRQHRAILVKAWNQSEQAYERVIHAEKKSSFVEELMAVKETAEVLPTTEAIAKQTEQQKEAAAEKANTTEQEMAAVAKQMSETQANVKAMQQEMAELSEQLTQRTQARQALSESLASLKAVASTLEDESLTTVAQTITASSTRAASAMGQTEAEMDETSQRLQQSTKQIQQLQATASAMQQQAETAKQQAAAASTRLNELKQQLTTLKAAAAESQTVVTEQATNQFQQAPVESLSAEQLAWSILQVTGQIDIHVAVELGKLNKSKPLTEDQAKDASVVAKRQAVAKAAAMKTLEKTVASFTSLFAAESGQPQDAFFATVDQALYFANGGPIQSWLRPSGNNLTGRLLKIEAPKELAEELYLSTLVRKPSPDEVKDVAEYLSSRGDSRKEAVQELAWGLITSAEFRFQY